MPATKSIALQDRVLTWAFGGGTGSALGNSVTVEIYTTNPTGAAAGTLPTTGASSQYGTGGVVSQTITWAGGNWVLTSGSGDDGASTIHNLNAIEFAAGGDALGCTITGIGLKNGSELIYYDDTVNATIAASQTLRFPALTGIVVSEG